ncbi:Csu type fimbrial protein [Rivibacter subsaxonicus]|uniref:Spore coat protein U-like protein n=1 Tax=Rivibacter subsaxonicus TaxID=457575 RepID=A0A4Q7VA25_9BURK|nr:spore coat protein U domain-containing protein [Rivibacter subsaxonicus]RZT93601.1 spore coat protein U-like protein [Rivibacter subsaxonicus]
MNFKRVCARVALASTGLLAIANAAVAATAIGTFPVTATVNNTCTVSSAAGVAFGAYAGAALTGTGTITLSCNKGVTVSSLFLGDGANVGTANQKRMLGAVGEYLNYNIDVPTGATLTTCPAAGTNEWNATGAPTGAELTTLFATTGGAKTIAICGSVPAGQFPQSGAYADTITMTLTYN